MIKYIDEKNTYVSKNVKIGFGVIIYPNVVIEGDSVIGDNSIIYPGTFIRNSKIGSNCEIYNSHIFDSVIENSNIIGPYAFIRFNCVIGNNNKIGTFVEIKNSSIKNNTKIPHLSYIGDSVIGSRVNIGAGTITANYDGKNKNSTIVEDDCFIGCNCNLVAPVILGRKSFIASGSTITDNVKENTLAIARAKQINKKNYYSNGAS